MAAACEVGPTDTALSFAVYDADGLDEQDFFRNLANFKQIQKQKREVKVARGFFAPGGKSGVSCRANFCFGGSWHQPEAEHVRMPEQSSSCWHLLAMAVPAEDASLVSSHPCQGVGRRSCFSTFGRYLHGIPLVPMRLTDHAGGGAARRSAASSRSRRSMPCRSSEAFIASDAISTPSWQAIILC